MLCERTIVQWSRDLVNCMSSVLLRPKCSRTLFFCTVTTMYTYHSTSGFVYELLPLDFIGLNRRIRVSINTPLQPYYRSEHSNMAAANQKPMTGLA